jgi:hypothetical protein
MVGFPLVRADRSSRLSAPSAAGSRRIVAPRPRRADTSRRGHRS